VTDDLPYEVWRAPDWYQQAACRGLARQGVILWYPPPEGEHPNQRTLRIQAATAVCEGCPVKEPCKQAGAEIPVTGDVIWGEHHTQHEHTAIRAQLGLSIPRRRSQCGTESGYQSHRRFDSPACRPCLEAHARYVADGKNQRGQVA